VTFRISAEGVDVDEVMREVRRRIALKKDGLLSDAEVRQIAEHRLDPVLDKADVSSRLLKELLDDPARWGYAFDAETLYRSSRGSVGQALERIRSWLRPVQKLFWNPNPMISALSRQADLNVTFVHLLHNLSLEVTRLNIELQDLRNRNLQLQGRLELLARREKTLEGLAVLRDEPEA
jgi:hypothetical protein